MQAYTKLHDTLARLFNHLEHSGDETGAGMAQEAIDMLPRWIAVTERLPEIDVEHGFTSVWVYCPLWGAFAANAMYVEDTKFVIWKDWNGKSCVPPTHWMPIPETPKP